MRHKRLPTCRQLNYRDVENYDDYNCDDYPLKNASPPLEASNCSSNKSDHVHLDHYHHQESDQLQSVKVGSSSLLNDENHWLERDAKGEQQEQVDQLTQSAIKIIHQHQVKNCNQSSSKRERRMPTKEEEVMSCTVGGRVAEISQKISSAEDEGDTSRCKVLIDLDGGSGVVISRCHLRMGPLDSPVSGRESLSPSPLESRVPIIELEQDKLCSSGSENSSTHARFKKLKKYHHSNKIRAATREKLSINDVRTEKESTTEKIRHTTIANSNELVFSAGDDDEDEFICQSEMSSGAADSTHRLLYGTSTTIDHSQEDQLTPQDDETTNDSSGESKQSNHIRHHHHQRSQRQPAKLTEHQIEQLANLINIIRRGNFNEFMDLLEKQSFRRSLLNVFVNGQTALHYSLLYGRSLAWCKQLVLNGANPNLTNRAGWHPIHLAAYSCSNDTMRYLLDCLGN